MTQTSHDRRRRNVMLVAAALPTAGVLLLLGVYLYVAAVFSEYPGAVRVPGGAIDAASLQSGFVSWQSEYQTEADRTAVQDWYMSRLGISPASDTSALTSGRCVYLAQAWLVGPWEQTTMVLLCTKPPGTRIVVNQGVRLLPLGSWLSASAK